MRALSIAITCLAILFFPRVAVAAAGDLRIGSYQGTWCNYAAIFSIDNQVHGKWQFNGTLIIPSTNQSDRLWVEQYDDDSLLMIRYLSNGLVQRVETAPPGPTIREGLVFDSTRVDGPGCKGTTTQLYTLKTDGF